MKLPFFGRAPKIAEPPEPEPCAPSSTETFRQILSAAKGLAVHHGLTRDDGETFHLNVGHVLASRYREDDRSQADFIIAAKALFYYCHPLASKAFADTAEIDLGEALDSRLSATMDIYGMAAGLAESGSMKAEWSPFYGPAETLWDAAMDGVSREDKEVRLAERTLAEKVIR